MCCCMPMLTLEGITKYAVQLINPLMLLPIYHGAQCNCRFQKAPQGLLVQQRTGQRNKKGMADAKSFPGKACASGCSLPTGISVKPLQLPVRNQRWRKSTSCRNTPQMHQIFLQVRYLNLGAGTSGAESRKRAAPCWTFGPGTWFWTLPALPLPPHGADTSLPAVPAFHRLS